MTSGMWQPIAARISSTVGARGLGDELIRRVADRSLHPPTLVCDAGASRRNLGERRAFVHRYVIRLVALNFVLRLIPACVNLVALELDLGGNHPYDHAANVTGLRIPTDVIAHFESFRRHTLPLLLGRTHGRRT